MLNVRNLHASYSDAFCTQLEVFLPFLLSLWYTLRPYHIQIAICMKAWAVFTYLDTPTSAQTLSIRWDYAGLPWATPTFPGMG
jgi:hypothetical protein